MIKIIVASLAALIFGSAFVGADNVRAVFGEARESVIGKMPLKTKIRVARANIEDLGGEYAEFALILEDTEEQLAGRRRALAGVERAITENRRIVAETREYLIEAGETGAVVIGRTAFSEEALRNDLSKRLESLKNLIERFNEEKAAVAHFRATVEVNRKRLDEIESLLNRKREDLQIKALEASSLELTSALAGQTDALNSVEGRVARSMSAVDRHLRRLTVAAAGIGTREEVEPALWEDPARNLAKEAEDFLATY